MAACGLERRIAPIAIAGCALQITGLPRQKPAFTIAEPDHSKPPPLPQGGADAVHQIIQTGWIRYLRTVPALKGPSQAGFKPAVKPASCGVVP